jgi:hypothetical protein
MKRILYTVTSAMLLTPFVVRAQFNPEPIPSMPDDPDANAVLLNVINWVLSILASLSVLMIIFAGIMYITSQGDEGRVDTAKKILTYAIVGLVVALLGYVIVVSVGGALGAG